ncbi:hypothetical protein [Alkalihalobacillus sp. AL-G]|uniref:hypothetical protein n=1 Tax=Alkalihalobacillus sp. AL-G TaxID=2926399 RepID=UPI00272AF587|nr:hypothetical protein [Alkalihalobacillus sp. AL-G]WLD93912.1 hypothetical protein MOJ78_03050 [Alkalihalobacillus sp. AL-G]
MERLLVKTGIYSFIISFSLMFVFIPREREKEFTHEAITELMNVGDYFFMIGRYSVMIMIAAVVLTFVGTKIRQMD